MWGPGVARIRGQCRRNVARSLRPALPGGNGPRFVMPFSTVLLFWFLEPAQEIGYAHWEVASTAIVMLAQSEATPAY